MLLAILQIIGDADDPYRIVAGLMAAVAPGSYLVLSHPASDILPEAMATMADRLNQRQRQADQVTFRTRAEVTRFFDGLELAEPGVVQPPALASRPRARSSRATTSPPGAAWPASPSPASSGEAHSP